MPIPLLCLALVEGLLLFGALYAGALIRFGGDFGDIRTDFGDVLPRALAFAALMLLGMSSMGLYHVRERHRLGGFALRLLAAFGLGWLGLSMLYYVYPDLYSGRGVLGLSIGLGAIAVSVVRPLFHRLIDDSGLKQRVLVLGTGERAAAIMHNVAAFGRRGVRVQGFVPCGTEPRRVPDDRVVEIPTGTLREYCVEHRVEEIVLAADDRRNSFSMQDLLACKLQGIDIVEQMTFFEREEGRVRLDLLYPGWLVFCDGCSRGTVRMATKRVFDMMVSTLLALISLPFTLLTALAIKLEDGPRAPVFYRQRRTGEMGQEFELLKFRSMRVDAESDGQARWAGQRDDRTTWVGAVIRRTRIDEIPQIFNVLRGEMSFVGPRPERPEFVAELAGKISYYRERHCLKPGITGWAQINYPYGASLEDARAKLEYDLYYVKNHSLLLDLYTLMSTAEVVMFGKERPDRAGGARGESRAP